MSVYAKYFLFFLKYKNNTMSLANQPFEIPQKKMIEDLENQILGTVPHKGCYLRRGRSPFKEKSFFPPQLVTAEPERRRRNSTPVCGIPIFASQKSKCHFLVKYSRKVYQLLWGTEQKNLLEQSIIRFTFLS